MSDAASNGSACVFLFSSDLMLISSVSGAAAAAGLAFISGTDPARLRQFTAQQTVLLCLDLGNPVADPQGLTEVLSPEQLLQAIAFGPHVHTARLELAKQAGFGKVMSRGQFVSKMRDEFLRFAEN